MKRRLFLFVITGLCVLNVGAHSLRLPPIFASGMVIQQQSSVELWGWAAPRAKVSVKVSWGKASHMVTAALDGRWSVAVLTPSAGFEPQTIKISCGEDRVELSDVLVGDVWFVSGQSNMHMNFHGDPDQPIENAQKILLRSRRDGLRLFRVERGYALNESDTISVNGAWYAATPNNVKEFSVVGYVFGEKLLDVVNIPIGLVQSTHGGSSAEAWLDRAALERFGEFDLSVLQGSIDPIWYAQMPTVLYNKMLKPMLPLSVKGVIWYQGESNVARAEQYKRLFAHLIRSWRGYFRNENMPFYYVQIAPYCYHDDINSAQLRESQLEVMREVPNVGMAVTLDVGEPTVIHPARKEVVGERLAYWALNRDYGHKAFGCRGPELSSMEVREGRAYLKFDFAPNGLSFYGKTPSGFQIAGDDKVFHHAEARITPAFWGNQGLEVWSEKVLEPIAVRYGYTNYVEGSLYNTEGLPASSFRTDRW